MSNQIGEDFLPQSIFEDVNIAVGNLYHHL